MTTAPKAYIAVPMSGHQDWNEPLARQLAEHVRAQGYEPIVPHDIQAVDHAGPCPARPERPYPGLGGHSGYCYLRADLRELLDAQVVFAAPGWQDSYGASVEVSTARAVGIKVVLLPSD